MIGFESRRERQNFTFQVIKENLYEKSYRFFLTYAGEKALWQGHFGDFGVKVWSQKVQPAPIAHLRFESTFLPRLKPRLHGRATVDFGRMVARPCDRSHLVAKFATLTR